LLSLVADLEDLELVAVAVLVDFLQLQVSQYL
jgi:hypothetical protein